MRQGHRNEARMSWFCHIQGCREALCGVHSWSLDPINQSISWSPDYTDPVNRYESSQALESHTDTALSSGERPGPSAWSGA